MAYKNISTLENLSKNLENFYDLFVQHYGTLNENIYINIYIVDRTREMRLDLVCSDVYGSIQNLQMLMQINNIENAFGIKEGDIIIWVDPKDLSKMNVIDPKILTDNRDSLITAFKASLTDPLRSQYLDNRGNDNLPPTILDQNAPKIYIQNNQIVIGGNLFTNPNNQTRTNDTGTGVGNSSLGDTFTGQDLNNDNTNGVTSPTLTSEEANGDTTERVLVKRFIRSGN